MITLNNNKEKLEFKDLSLKKIFNYLISKFRKTKGGITIPEEDLIEFSEVILYRALSCPECVRDKACLKSKGGCGCPVPQLFAAFDAECGRQEKRWYGIPNKDWKNYWKEYKEKQGVQFIKLYNK